MAEIADMLNNEIFFLIRPSTKIMRFMLVHLTLTASLVFLTVWRTLLKKCKKNNYLKNYLFIERLIAHKPEPKV